MAKKDALTGKGALIGNSRSHALNATKRKWDLNLHKVKFTDENNHTHKIKVSARTLKTLRKQAK